VDSTILEGLAGSFSFAEIHTRTIQTRFCGVVCETGSDRDTLENCGGIILPMGHMTLYVTFSPTADDTVRTSLPKEIRLALRSHKALFYPSGLVLSVASSISAPALFIFKMTLFTLMCLTAWINSTKCRLPPNGPGQYRRKPSDVRPRATLRGYCALF